MRRYPGNTLTEYGIILGLVAVLSVAGLYMMGGSVSGLFGNMNSTVHQPGVMNMMNLNYNGHAVSGKNSVTSGTSVAGQSTGSDGNPAVLGMSDGSASGSNATSVEGKMAQAAYGSIQVVNRLTALANSLPPGSEKDWLTYDYIPRIQFLATAEGYAAGINSFTSQIPNYSKAAALDDLNKFQAQLVYSLQDPSYSPDGVQEFTATLTPAQLQQVTAIATPAIQQAQSLVGQASPGTTVLQSSDINTIWNNNLFQAVSPADASPENFGSQTLDVVTNAIGQAQANQTINQSTAAATSATSADTLTQTAATLPGK